jgi:hypothetical protein
MAQDRTIRAGRQDGLLAKGLWDSPERQRHIPVPGWGGESHVICSSLLPSLFVILNLFQDPFLRQHEPSVLDLAGPQGDARPAGSAGAARSVLKQVQDDE